MDTWNEEAWMIDTYRSLLAGKYCREVRGCESGVTMNKVEWVEYEDNQTRGGYFL